LFEESIRLTMKIAAALLLLPLAASAFSPLAGTYTPKSTVSQNVIKSQWTMMPEPGEPEPEVRRRPSTRHPDDEDSQSAINAGLSSFLTLASSLTLFCVLDRSPP
jgi:hypothetical protein